MVRFRKTSKSKLLKRGGKSVKKRGKTLKKKGKSVKRGGKYNKNKRGKRRNTLKRGGFLGLFGGPPESFKDVYPTDSTGLSFRFDHSSGYYIHHNYPGYKYSRTSNGSDSGSGGETYDYTIVRE